MSEPAELLLSWYDRAHRRLPWRSEPTPYRVLLSEFMLQQTRVDTVIPYFERFVTRWPDLNALASASDEDVLSAWAGLGYYRRARSLLAAARAAAGQGGLPRTAQALQELPGVGPYTAGAIASIAFAQPAAAVDGNVERVISRLDARHEDPARAAGKRAIRARVLDLQPSDRPGDFNQALMELGATVCTPRRPTCPLCPWRETCQAHAQGIAEELPNKAKKKKPVPIADVSGLLRLDGGWLLARRPAGARLGGLWEPPSGPAAEDESPEHAVVRVFAERVGVAVAVQAHLGQVVHVFTHRRLTRQVFQVVPQGVAEPRAAIGTAYDAATIAPDGALPALSKLALKTLALAR